MLPVRMSGAGEPAIVMLHFLGGSAREWDEVRAMLEGTFRCVAIDLPGFGEATDVPGYTVAETADAVSEVIDSLGLGRYILVGHSMGGKVSAVLARRAADGPRNKAEPAGLVLVAPSPPEPEPIPDEKRASMLAAFDGQKGMAHDWSAASRYISKNETRILPPDVHERAVRDVLRMNRAAWTAWLEDGSREDWAGRVGTLELPTWIVAGENDTSLGEQTQRSLTMPHFSNGSLMVVAGCGHLIPMEKPARLAGLIRDFVGRSGERAAVPESYLRLIESDRVSPKTREVLLARMETPADGLEVFDTAEISALCAVLGRVIPQEAGGAIDLAARLDRQLARGKGDGWRYAVLPGDREAYRTGLRRLDELARERHESSFAALSGGDQDELLKEIAVPDKDAPAMARWFEDLRADAVAIYVAHPSTLARLGYSGVGVGGAHTPHRGFVQMSVGDREPWEPLAGAGAKDQR